MCCSYNWLTDRVKYKYNKNDAEIWRHSIGYILSIVFQYLQYLGIEFEMYFNRLLTWRILCICAYACACVIAFSLVFRLPVESEINACEQVSSVIYG